jgi:hypothetical protein
MTTQESTAGGSAVEGAPKRIAREAPAGAGVEGAHDAGRAGTGRRYWLLYPEYGTLRAILGFGLFYLTVALVTPVVVDLFAEFAPAVASATVTTGAAVLLWLSLTLTLLDQGYRQVTANPHRFADREALVEFLDANRPTTLEYALAGGGVLVTATVVVATWRPFVVALPELVWTMTHLPTAGAPSIVTSAIVVGFIVAFTLCTYGTDRLVVGAVREALYRAHR